MYKSGCVDALVILAKRSEHPRNQGHKLSPRIRLNCASALRSMTYNEGIRDELRTGQAIDIMLEEDDKIQYNLLVELEAESWANGARGTQREGRAARIPPNELCVDFLKEGGGAQLTVDEKRYADLEKYHVQVQLDEPNLEVGDHVASLDIGINDLASYEDGDSLGLSGGEGGSAGAGAGGKDQHHQQHALQTKRCPKQEVELVPLPMSLLKSRRDDPDGALADFAGGDFGGGGGELDLDDSRLVSSSVLPTLRSSSANPNPALSGLFDKRPSSPSSGDLPAINNPAQPSSPGEGKKSKRAKVVKRKDPTEAFGDIVAMIKAGGTTDQVVDTWTKLSRF
jgi:hypothetical protein